MSQGYLSEVYSSAVSFGVALGGPDLLPFSKGAVKPRLIIFFLRSGGKFQPLLRSNGIITSTLIPQPEHEVTIRELYDFAKNDLKVDSIFWCTQEPYFSKNLIPFLKGIGVRSTWP